MISYTDTQLDVRVISDHGFARVILNEVSGQKSLIATKKFKPGELISLFHAGTTSSRPTYLTVQVGDKKHITLQPEFLQYINHSCDPNAFFNTTTMELTCLKAMKPGDEFSFFYPSTEWNMAQPFDCYCGSPKCLHTISGASHIAPEILDTYKLTDYIQSKRVEK